MRMMNNELCENEARQRGESMYTKTKHLTILQTAIMKSLAAFWGI